MRADTFGKIILAASVAVFQASACKSSAAVDGAALKRIIISPAEKEMHPGDEVEFTAETEPSGYDISGARWSVRDKAVATIDENGKLRANAVGTTSVTLAFKGVTGSAKITVKEKPLLPESISVYPSTLLIKKGASANLSVSPVPEGASLTGKASYTSDNLSVASVDESGKVTGKAEGKAVITVKWGGFEGTCNVEVYSNLESRDFTFFQLNIWEGATNIDNGVDALYRQLASLLPDAASFCEFRSLEEAEKILDGAIDYIKTHKGIQYYRTCRSGSGTRGLLTRFPVLETGPVKTESGGDMSWFYRTVIDFYGQEIALYSSHAYHSYYACYLPRGYGDGAPSWDKMPGGPVTDIAYILSREELSGRSDIAKALVKETKAQEGHGRISIFGGDLNQPSHLDWTESTKNLLEHNGCVVPWPISSLCYAGGIKDAFRTVYPNPVTHPGVTWPVYNKDGHKPTQWAAEADERDRIDYIYYYDNGRVRPLTAKIVGPDTMVSHSAPVKDVFVNKSEEHIAPAEGRWPSDHRGVLVKFEIKHSDK